MTEQDTYMHGSSYEIFIRRAFHNCERGQHGAENAYFKFLLMADLGKNFLSKPYEKRLAEIKTYLHKAIDKYLSRKPTDIEREYLENMKTIVDYATTGTELVDPITKGLEVTRRYRDL